MSGALILDWGIGGLPTLTRLRARLPELPLTYLSDSGYTPYGRVPHEELAARLEQLTAHFRPSALIVACNAASSALSAERPLAPLTLDVISAGVDASLSTLLSLSSPAPRLGLIGGHATIQAQAYERRIKAHWRDPRPLTLISEPAQELSAHVEAGRLSGDELSEDLDALCERLGELDALTLACTHYPALAPQLSVRLPGVRLIDPVARFAERAYAALQGAGLCKRPNKAQGELKIYTTGSPEAFERSARAAWGVTPPAPCHPLPLNLY